MKAKLLKPLPSYTLEHEDYYFFPGEIVDVYPETAEGEPCEDYTGLFWLDTFHDSLTISGLTENDLELI